MLLRQSEISRQLQDPAKAVISTKYRPARQRPIVAWSKLHVLCMYTGLRHIHGYQTDSDIASGIESAVIYWCGLCECSCSDNIDCVISHACDQQHRTNYMVTCLLTLLVIYLALYV